MVTLQKRYTTGPHYKLVRGQEATNSVHSVSNQKFCDNIHNYSGWTIIDINYDIYCLCNIKQDYYLASCIWHKGFVTTCFDTIEDLFDSTKNILLDLKGKTICTAGALDSPDIIYYQNIVKKYNIAQTNLVKEQVNSAPELELVAC